MSGLIQQQFLNLPQIDAAIQQAQEAKQRNALAPFLLQQAQRQAEKGDLEIAAYKEKVAREKQIRAAMIAMNQQQSAPDAQMDVMPAGLSAQSMAGPDNPMSPRIAAPDWLQQAAQQVAQRPVPRQQQSNPYAKQAEMLRRQAQVYAQLGDVNTANKLQEDALKLEPEYDATPRYDQDGNAFVTSKQGAPRMLNGIKARDELVSDDLGGTRQLRTKFSPVPVSTMAKTLTPEAFLTDERTRSENALNRGVQWANHGLAKQRLEFDQSTPKGQIVTTADGGVVLVDPRAATAQPVTDQDGKQVIGKMAGQLTPKQISDAKGKLQTITTLRMQIENLKKVRGNLGNFSEGIVGGRNKLSEAGSNYDGALAALQTTIRQLTRTPGEGSMSDYESRMANAQLPQRADFSSTIDQKIGQLEDLANVIETGYTGMLDSAPTAKKPPKSAPSNVDALLQKYGPK